MLTEPLSTMLDVRKAAVRGAGVSGVLKPLDLGRFWPLLGGDEGSISVKMAFSRDEESRYLVRVAIEADIVVTCQRCLEAMPDHLSCENTLAILWTDEEAAYLPKHLDPLVIRELSCNLWELVEDELILALRPFSYHNMEDCKMKIAAFSAPAPQQGTGESKPNPFNVLGQLKPSNKY
jgi:uncharacterized protein